MSAVVWITRRPDGSIYAAHETDLTTGVPLAFGWTCTRETLLAYREQLRRLEIGSQMYSKFPKAMRQRVEHEERQHEAFFKRMDTACTDGETCDLCGAVSKIREMVDLADDVVLLCLECAPMLRRRAGKVE